jgi:hypothetical protein
MSERGAGPAEGIPDLGVGYLAALPLFLAYELGQSSAEARAPAERIVAHLLSVFEGRLQWLRVMLLLGFALLAVVHAGRGKDAAGRGLLRQTGRAVAEGWLAGFLLGPVLLVLQGWLAGEPLVVAPPPARSLEACLRLMGAAPWEELLFRVGAYGALFLAARRIVEFLGLATPLASGLAELAALVGSAFLFAWFHLDSAQRLLGIAGEPYHGGLFLWRVSAGILLGALFRWRGFGVAAWAHGVFNLGVALGIGA